ncbi:MAG: family 20 glycosylhydrolase [Lentisphaeria bacterium]|nr:family 20 glycosylhydrolase [Lentisphaeria bacterium]
MSDPSKKVYLHLDFKGIVPELPRLLQYLTWFRDLGFDGIVPEYDLRIDWRTWPGAPEPCFSREDIAGINAHCEKIGLEVIPLMQCLGHFEWVLRHEKYAHLRENGFRSEFCPSHPETAARMREFLQEVLELHPRARMIHLGADETWHLASCPRCAGLVRNAPEGKLAVYLKYVSQLCRDALARGVRPLIWADMFWRESRLDLVDRMPREAILVNWEYRADASPDARNAALAAGGNEVWGASALQCFREDFWARADADHPGRLANIGVWNARSVNVICTTWGRPSNLWPLYAPWPSIHREFMEASPRPVPPPAELAELGEAWDRLAEEAASLLARGDSLRHLRAVLRVSGKYTGDAPELLTTHFEPPLAKLEADSSAWCEKTGRFFRRARLLSGEEFIAERRAAILAGLD